MFQIVAMHYDDAPKLIEEYDDLEMVPVHLSRSDREPRMSVGPL